MALFARLYYPVRNWYFRNDSKIQNVQLSDSTPSWNNADDDYDDDDDDDDKRLIILSRRGSRFVGHVFARTSNSI